MKLTPENKAIIDAKSYQQLLYKWRYGPIGDPWFQDETGKYWGERIAELRSQDNSEAVRASKAIGWNKP